MEADELWAKAEQGCGQARSTLIVNYLPLVRYIAGQMRMSLPRHVDIEDLIAYGNIGLIGAVDRFDRTRGVPFTAFASQRIRGSILDEIRSQDWAPRRVRRNGRDLGTAVSALNARLQRDPTLEEIADEMGLDSSVVSKRAAEIENANHYSLDFEIHGTGTDTEDEEVTPYGLLTSPGYVEERAVEGDHAARVAGAISRLDGEERTLIALYYFENCTFAQIAELLGVTESRVFQIHSNAMRILRVMATVNG